ncbi:MAG TPA: hypothetical protein VJ833_10210 [Rhodanobacteraceae bacterium]|nr:hypothetical protein [Rhodanobacteraceae bacterium]
MDGPQIRRSPRGGASFEVDQQIGFARQLYGDAERTARAGYRGATRSPALPSPGDPAAIARDLHAASGHLAALAELIGAEHFDAQTLTNADALLVGAGRLICELRQRGWS